MLFLCNTDGVAIFKSSKCSLWPIWIVINELPPMVYYDMISLLDFAHDVLKGSLKIASELSILGYLPKLIHFQPKGSL